MTEKRKKELRHRYLHLRGIVARASENASCGETLLRFISPEVDAACREMDAIKAEVIQAMKEEAPHA